MSSIKELMLSISEDTENLKKMYEESVDISGALRRVWNAQRLSKQINCSWCGFVNTECGSYCSSECAEEAYQNNVEQESTGN